MATYQCTKCNMAVNATCAKCNANLVNDILKLEDGWKFKYQNVQMNMGK